MSELHPEQDPNLPSTGTSPDHTEEAGSPQQPQPEALPQQPQYAPPQAQQQPQYAPPQQPMAPSGQPYEGQYPQYPVYPAGGQYPPVKPPMNVFAIVSFVGSFFFALVGIVFGHIALSKIKRTGEGGRGLALAGTIIGYVRVGLAVLGTVLLLFFFGAAAAFQDGYDSEFGDTDSYYDEQFEQGFSDMPWAGTENEEFCDALLLSDDLESGNEAAYLENLLGFTEDPDLTSIIDDQIAFAEADESAETSAEHQQRVESAKAWASARSELTLGCMGEARSATP